MSDHYRHLRRFIEDFFAQRGIAVQVEPRGSRGPDIESAGEPRTVGEIKSDAEVARDLRGYWSQWNSDRRFGGKSETYRLADQFPESCLTLESTVRGWLCVIYGQLRHYCTSARTDEGWLIVENIKAHGAKLIEAVEYLSHQRKAILLGQDTQKGIGFFRIRFLAR